MPAEELWIWIAAFSLSSLAGFASVLRRSAELPTWVTVLTGMLNGGLSGLVVALISYSHLIDQIPLLIGLAVLAGFGGSQIQRGLLFFLKLRGLKIVFVPSMDDEQDDSGPDEPDEPAPPHHH